MSNHHFSKILSSFFLPFCLLLFSCSQIQKADMVIQNGTIYTMDENNQVAEAVAVAEGKIVFVGNSTEAKKRIVNDIKNYNELVDRVLEAVQKAGPGVWILGRGWHQSKWEPQPVPIVRGFQTHHALSKVSPDNPVFLKHASGHAGFANAKAMEIAGVKRTTTFTSDGEIIKDDNGIPTGIFNEDAQELIKKHIPESTPETDRRALERGIEECLAHGITTFHDALSTREAIDLYKKFLNK